MWNRGGPAVIICGSVLIATAAAVASSHVGKASLVSRASGAQGAKARGDSALPVISADGRYIAFNTDAANLVSRCGRVVVRDTGTARVSCVARSDGPSGRPASDAWVGGISASGRLVVFSSTMPVDAGAFRDNVFVRDMRSQRTTLVSRASGEGPAGDGGSTSGSISADGRWVAFSSRATNLTPDDRDAQQDVFVREHGLPGSSRAESSDAAISADGRRVAFDSDATNLNRADTDQHFDVYVRDIG